ncbi:hypothetical protein COU57_00590 [Candidatus Pacearchaeota archaeon CG10_big_fil_rev_8_21_14_0_10_32_14]|nr:MAG: hypothetical protein COU57_00590 [Candidatus Pacearchaeota archaeon CG10_big_fil_rev_8_21_14_0_10_32_14]
MKKGLIGLAIIIILLVLSIIGYFYLTKISVKECLNFPNKLKSCGQYSCEFEHPLTKTRMNRTIAGFEGNFCKYIEDMPNNGKMECLFPKGDLQKYSDYYKILLKGKEIETSSRSNFNGTTDSKIIVDGEEIENYLSNALNNGTCKIKGYRIGDDRMDSLKNELITDKHCEFLAMYSYCANDEYCFPLIDKCVKWNSTFKDFILNRTQDNPDINSCDQSCTVCEKGEYIGFDYRSDPDYPMIPSPANEGIDKLQVCFECYDSMLDKGYGCIEGYHCDIGKCIVDN